MKLKIFLADLQNPTDCFAPPVAASQQNIWLTEVGW